MCRLQDITVQENQPHIKPFLYSTQNLPNNHPLPVQESFLQTKAWLSHGPLLSSTVVNLYIKEMESKALTTYKGITPVTSLRQIDVTSIKPRTRTYSLHRAHQYSGGQQWVHVGGCWVEQPALLRLCNWLTHWLWLCVCMCVWERGTYFNHLFRHNLGVSSVPHPQFKGQGVEDPNRHTPL